MKIELQHRELNEAVSLWLEKNMTNGVKFDVQVSRVSALASHIDKPAQYTLTATAEAPSTYTTSAVAETS